MKQKMKVLFVNSQKQKREIAQVEGMNQAYEEIKKFCGERNFEVHYLRVWQRDGIMKVDVGSHSEFFHIVK